MLRGVTDTGELVQTFGPVAPLLQALHRQGPHKSSHQAPGRQSSVLHTLPANLKTLTMHGDSRTHTGLTSSLNEMGSSVRAWMWRMRTLLGVSRACFSLIG